MAYFHVIKSSDREFVINLGCKASWKKSDLKINTGKSQMDLNIVKK